ncbi:WD40 repeat-like protein, partial [Sistotremastrum niveocremeum HHB9708]
RTLNNAFSGASDKIKNVNANFIKLRQAFQEQAFLQTELVAIRVEIVVQDIARKVDLLDMHYAKGATFIPEKGCLPGTRIKLLEQISQTLMRWTDPDLNGASLLWLKGPSGSGKSAVSHTLASLFARGKRLGSSFIFDQSDENIRLPQALFRTIALDLADLLPEWKDALWTIIRDNRALRYTKSVKVQFEQLILEPSKRIRLIGPILIVIDALDECAGDSSGRQELLSILSSRLNELPSNFHIFLTSRPENDIVRAFRHCPYVTRLEVGGDTDDPSDIVTVCRRRLVDDHPNLAKRLDEVPDKHDWLGSLFKQSKGLFQWATASCNFVVEPESEDEQFERYQLVVARSSSIDDGTALSEPNSDPLGELYSLILTTVFRSPHKSHLFADFHTIIGRVLMVFRPLSISALNALCIPGENEEVLKSVLMGLSSVLTGVSAESKDPVRVFHTSFRDFLFDERRSGVFYIDPSIPHVALAIACLQVMNTELKFNMCNLPTSYTVQSPSKDVLHCCVSEQLLYASEFWSHHLAETIGEADQSLIELIQEFVNTKFLFWLELLGLTQKIFWAGSAMRTMVKWASTCRIESLVDFGTDAEMFISNFAEVIARSPPHLYISVLPFAPEKSLVSQQYLSLFGNTIRAQSGKQQVWSEVIRSSAKHESPVLTVSFSPNVADPVIVSSSDRSVRLWDGASGSPVGKPVEGQNGICSVLFSPDGQFIATGAWDGTISLLDRQADGARIRSTGSPMCGHTGTILALAISLDGKLLASGSADRTICIWDVEAEDPPHKPRVLHGHTAGVREVVFDKQGKHLVSCSDDSTIRVWDIVDWTSVELRGHKLEVYSVQFYDNGNSIVSGSQDRTIRIWNANTGEPIGDPLRLHNTYVFRIALSPSEELVASSSIDGYIHHGTGYVRSIVFTSDEQHLLSAAEDHTIRLWDLSAEEPRQVGRPWEGHNSEVKNAFFLNNESQIISSSDDGTIRVWDVNESATNPNSPAELQISFPRIDYDGWVHSDEEEPKLLFWLPPHYRWNFVW